MVRLSDDVPCLAIVAGPISKRFVRVDSDVTIGRDPSSDLCIYSDDVSQAHAKIGRDGDGNHYIEGLESGASTLVNGQTVEKQLLRFGDTIQIAGAIMVFVSSRLVEGAREPQDRESFGAQAAGVGHRFNNVMSVVLTNVSFLRNMAINGDISQKTMLDALSEIESAAVQAIDMTGQLLGFAELRRDETSATNISELIAEVSMLARNIFDSKVTIRVQAEPELVIEGDRAKLQTMLMNLCLTARDSMPDGGELTLMAGLEEMTEELFPIDHPTSNEPWVVITIKDTGVGLNEDACKQVFTPLFTTTFDSGGSGLGLTVIYGVVQAHNGYVAIETEPERGTTFKMYFPPFQEGATPIEPWSEPSPGLNDTQSILLIDDDPTVLRSTRRLLEQRGYDVICASNGQVALEIFREQGEHIDLVMLDLVMPIMDGIEAFGLIKEAKADVPVIIASGCREREVRGQDVFERWGKPVFLAKPFNQQSLYEALERVFP